jgi:uncharacterized protein YjbJ (UPF0337 family)
VALAQVEYPAFAVECPALVSWARLPWLPPLLNKCASPPTVPPRRLGTVRQAHRNFRPIRALNLYRPKQMEKTVDREHIKGAADKAKGAIKDAAGKLTGDKELQTEGKTDKAKGAAHNAAGNVKDAARDLTK